MNAHDRTRLTDLLRLLLESENAKQRKVCEAFIYYKEGFRKDFEKSFLERGEAALKGSFAKSKAREGGKLRRRTHTIDAGLQIYLDYFWKAKMLLRHFNKIWEMCL